MAATAGVAWCDLQPGRACSGRRLVHAHLCCRCLALHSHRVTHARGRAGPVARSPPNTLAELTLGVASTLPHAHRALRRVCQCTQLVPRSRFGQGNTRSRARRAGCAVSSKHSGRANRADPECRLTAFTCVPQPCHTRSGHCIECAYIRSGRPAIDSHRVTRPRARRASCTLSSKPSGRAWTEHRLTTFTFAVPNQVTCAMGAVASVQMCVAGA